MKTNINLRQSYLQVLLAGFLIMAGVSVSAQELPPIPIHVEVSTAQFMNFGAFTTGESGGTISVDWQGNITSTGDVIRMHLGDSPSAALFDVFANPGTIISIMTPPRITLQGSNGGEIILEINDYSTGQTFITTANQLSPNEVYVGGTLTVGNQMASRPGRYHGNFNLTFVHQ